MQHGVLPMLPLWRWCFSLEKQFPVAAGNPNLKS
jgi:hypothetical protein